LGRNALNRAISCPDWGGGWTKGKR